MDLLPLEFAKLERPLASGPAPSDSSDFYEELLQAERAQADDSAPAEEDPWEPTDRPAERTDPPKPEEPPESTSRDAGPDSRPVEADQPIPDGNAAEATNPAEELPTGIATLIDAPAAPSPVTAADASFGSGFGPAGPLAPAAGVQALPAELSGVAKTPLGPSAEVTPQAATISTRPTVNDALLTARGAHGNLVAPPQSQPAPGPALGSAPKAPISAPIAPTQPSETPIGQVGAELIIQKSPDTKTKPLNVAAIKGVKTGQSEAATLARRAALRSNAADLRAALGISAKLGAGAHKAGPAEGAGGGAFAAFVNGANFVNPAGSPGPMLNAFGIGLPNALPQAGGTADAVLSDGQSVARRGAAVEQVAVRLQVAVKQGQDRINIRLHPAELGRVEVKLDLAEDGPLRAVLIAERSDTLELLQRDAGQLERTLAQAGLKLDSGSLNFSLQGQAHDGDGTGEKGSTGAGSGHSDAGDEDLSVPDGRWSIHDGVLDLVI